MIFPAWVGKKKRKERASKFKHITMRMSCNYYKKSWLETFEGHKKSFSWLIHLLQTPQYEATQLKVFAQMYEKGYIYRALKPCMQPSLFSSYCTLPDSFWCNAGYWSPSSRTALAEAEIEYSDNHTSQAVLVAFQLSQLSPALEEVQELPRQMHALIWTTTPWTLPGLHWY